MRYEGRVFCDTRVSFRDDFLDKAAATRIHDAEVQLVKEVLSRAGASSETQAKRTALYDDYNDAVSRFYEVVGP